MQNKLHIFGDSFASDYSKSWTRTVATYQNLEVCNYAAGGTSVEWSALKFMDATFRDGDVVIFVISHCYRFDIEPFISERPTEASTAKEFNTLSTMHQWYVTNRSQKVLDLKPQLYTSLIFSMSQKIPSVKFIVISGFVDSKNSSIVKKTSNYLMLDSISLNEISHDEVNETKLNPYMLYNVCGLDPRVNHLTSTNLNNLANSINDVIECWDETKYNKSRFAKNVINSHVKNIEELYTHYVDSGILYDEWIQHTKRPVTFQQGSRWHKFKQWILEL